MTKSRDEIEIEYYKKRDADALVLAQFLVSQVDNLTLTEAFCMATNWRTTKEDSVGNALRNLVIMEKLAKGDEIISFRISMDTYVQSIIDHEARTREFHLNRYKRNPFEHRAIYSKYDIKENIPYRTIKEDIVILLDRLLKDPTTLTWKPSKYELSLMQLLQDYFGNDIKLEKRGMFIIRWSVTPKERARQVREAINKMTSSSFILKIIGL